MNATLKPGTFTSIMGDLKTAHQLAYGYLFHPANSKVGLRYLNKRGNGQGIYDGHLFITSSRTANGRGNRRYTVMVAHTDGRICCGSLSWQYATANDAEKAIQFLISDWHKRGERRCTGCGKNVRNGRPRARKSC